MKLKSPAKLNLFLNVLRKRKDGYHEIETLFERISLCDYLSFRRAPSGIQIRSNSKQIPLGPRNLVHRAAKLLKDRFHIKEGVRIKIHKNIPVAAGLGGGSSNAATALLGLNRLWNLGLGRSRLLTLAGELGSDVPFFILKSSFALGQGRGEILKKILAPTRKIWHCLVLPNFRISTRQAYARFKPSSLTPPKTDVKMLLHSIQTQLLCASAGQKGDSDSLSKLLVNSLELSLNNRVKEIYKIKKRLLDEGALGCLLSGSGSAVFGIFRSRSAAAKSARFLKQNKNWKVFVASTL